MKAQDKLRKQMILLSLQIENCQCPETKTRLLNRARVLLASATQNKKNEARARISQLQSTMPPKYLENPHGLTIIEERQPGFEKLLPFINDLKKGERIKNQIQTLSDQHGIDIRNNAKSTKKNTRRNKPAVKGKLAGKRYLKHCDNKFHRLEVLNKTMDDSSESLEVRTSFRKGKARLVNYETEFNGTRRNDKPTNTRQSWNPEGNKLAGAKGAK